MKKDYKIFRTDIECFFLWICLLLLKLLCSAAAGHEDAEQVHDRHKNHGAVHCHWAFLFQEGERLPFSELRNIFLGDGMFTPHLGCGLGEVVIVMQGSTFPYFSTWKDVSGTQGKNFSGAWSLFVSHKLLFF